MRNIIPSNVKARIIANVKSGLSRAAILRKYNLKHSANISSILRKQTHQESSGGMHNWALPAKFRLSGRGGKHSMAFQIGSGNLDVGKVEMRAAVKSEDADDNFSENEYHDDELDAKIEKVC